MTVGSYGSSIFSGILLLLLLFSLIFVILTVMCLAYSSVGQSWMGFCAFWLGWLFLSFQFKEVFKYYLFIYFISPFLYVFSFCDLIIQILVCWMLSQISLKLSITSFFILFLSVQWQWFPLLSSSTLICYFVSFSLLWIPSSVFFIKFAIVFWILFVFWFSKLLKNSNFSYLISIFLLNSQFIFMIITLNYFLGRFLSLNNLLNSSFPGFISFLHVKHIPMSPHLIPNFYLYFYVCCR